MKITRPLASLRLVCLLLIFFQNIISFCICPHCQEILSYIGKEKIGCHMERFFCFKNNSIVHPQCCFGSHFPAVTGSQRECTQHKQARDRIKFCPPKNISPGHFVSKTILVMVTVMYNCHIGRTW